MRCMVSSSREVQSCRPNDKRETATYSDNSSHDHGHDTLHHQIGTEDSHGGDSHTRFRGSVGGSDTCSTADASV